MAQEPYQHVGVTPIRILVAGSRVPSASMATASDRTATPLLDEWISEVGEEQVVMAVKAAIRAVEDGTTPGFTDKEALLAYIGRRRFG